MQCNYVEIFVGSKSMKANDEFGLIGCHSWPENWQNMAIFIVKIKMCNKSSQWVSQARVFPPGKSMIDNVVGNRVIKSVLCKWTHLSEWTSLCEYFICCLRCALYTFLRSRCKPLMDHRMNIYPQSLSKIS